jgi:hypothetical protein
MTPTALDRVKTYLARIIDGQTRRMDFLAFYPCKVVTQRADGTLDLQPEDARLPSMSQVPIRLGIPGVAVKVLAGSRVLLGFEGGDQRRPVASLWQFDGAKLLALDIGDSPSSYLALATATKAALDDLQAKFNAHTHPVVFGACTAGGTTGTAPTAATGLTSAVSTNVASTVVRSL